MGLLKAGIGAATGVLADSWRDFFYCDSLDANTLVVKGRRRVGDRSSNVSGEANIISNGSVIAVNEGQCMMIVENGAVIEVCAEPGEFLYDEGTEPSLFYGDMKEGIMASLEQIGQRFIFGGSPGKDQRVYYFNTKEIIGNKYGTQQPVPFRVVDPNIGLDVDIAVRCNGEYSYKIVNPMLFYKELSGNIGDRFTRDQIDSQLKSELLTALQPAFARISEMGVRYSSVPGHTKEMAAALNEELTNSWARRGIAVAAFGMNSITARPEDEELIKNLQQAAVLSRPDMAGGFTAAAAGDAMRAAAANDAGAAVGFMGMGMANAMGGSSAASMFAQAQQAPAAPAAEPFVAAAGWTCECGAQNTGKFCPECGKPQPAPAESWTCACGSVNAGKFCPECGKPRPVDDGAWTCSCGAQNTGKFCQECGTPRP
ncbi:MAG: SPFH domain-containing protein [Coriobacteriia bacterium]|nr:SPFH domain-containing protein [Coriobacteriia bacterium]